MLPSYGWGGKVKSLKSESILVADGSAAHAVFGERVTLDTERLAEGSQLALADGVAHIITDILVKPLVHLVGGVEAIYHALSNDEDDMLAVSIGVRPALMVAYGAYNVIANIVLVLIGFWAKVWSAHESVSL
jgi:hypothetical protein